MLNQLKGTIDKELREFRKTMFGENQNINKKIENTKRNQTEVLALKSIIIEINNSPEVFNIRREQAEERISELEDNIIGTIQSEGQKEKKSIKMNRA